MGCYRLNGMHIIYIFFLNLSLSPFRTLSWLWISEDDH